MDYILVDTENVSDYKVIEGILEISKNIQIILFKSKNSKPIKPIYWDILFRNNTIIKTFEVCGSGNQNMDIQMAGYLGYLLGSADAIKNVFNNKFFIVSNDNHFLNLSNFFKSINKKIDLVHLKNPTSENSFRCLFSNIIKDENRLVQIEKTLNDLLINSSVKFNYEDIYNIFINSNSKSKFHNDLRSKYPNLDILIIYKELSKYIKS